jgi:hypothetical protein
MLYSWIKSLSIAKLFLAESCDLIDVSEETGETLFDFGIGMDDIPGNAKQQQMHIDISVFKGFGFLPDVSPDTFEKRYVLLY